MASENVPVRKSYPNGLLKRFRKTIFWLYVVSVVVSVPIVYFTTQQQIHAEANKELTLLVDMVKAVREYIAEDVRPGLLKANLFESPAISSTVTTSVVAKHFQKQQPDYYIKVASDNPMNPRNRPEPLEKELIKRFRADEKLENIIETGMIKGKSYLVSSRPSKAREECLICHGDPKEAPKAITTAYGVTDGYNYKVGSVVGAMAVGVPLADVQTLVVQRAGIVIGILTIVFGLIFVTINNLVKRQIIQPVANITAIAIAVSEGDLDRKIDIARDGSEIGELSQAFEKLRRSLLYSMQKMGG